MPNGLYRRVWLLRGILGVQTKLIWVVPKTGRPILVPLNVRYRNITLRKPHIITILACGSSGTSFKYVCVYDCEGIAMIFLPSSLQSQTLSHYKLLHKPSFNLIFRFLFHLILHYLGRIIPVCPFITRYQK